MLKRENVKQAIDAISKRNPEIGYSLDEMLAAGHIDVPSRLDETSQVEDLYFFFENQKVLVNKFIYINEGTVPLEQQLLIKYGELAEKRRLLMSKDPIDYRKAAMAIREAGLRLMVTYEIDYAITNLKQNLKTLGVNTAQAEDSIPIRDTPLAPLESRNKVEFYKNLISFLEKIKRNDPMLKMPRVAADPAVLYQGVVNDDTPASFMRFPFCMDSLMQVADSNPEFFHVRFILNRLIQRLEKNLFACVVEQKIIGLVYIKLKEWIFYKRLEIKFIATLSAQPDNYPEPAAARGFRGIGTFLVAGVWLLGKTGAYRINEILLDSEIGARRFYESIGFQPRGFSGFALASPRGYLVRAILIMANNSHNLDKNGIKEIKSLIRKQIRFMSKKAQTEKEQSAGKSMVVSVKECLKSNAHPEFAEAAIGTLIKYQKKIPEYKELIQFALKYGSSETKAYIKHAANTCC